MTRSLGERIREFRQKKGLTQSELSQGFITPSMVSQIESDRARPSYKVLSEIASRLDVSLEQLLQDVNIELEYSSKYKLAVSMVRSKEYSAAIPLLESLLAISLPKIPKDNVLLELARCHLELGNAREAESKLDQLLNKEQSPEMLPLILLLSGKAAELKSEIPIALFRTKRALEEIQRMETIDVDLHVQILVQTAFLLDKIGKAEEAADYYELALQMERGSAEERAQTYLRLAKVYDRQKKFEQAEEYASKAAVLLEEQSNAKVRQELQHRSIMLLRGSEEWTEAVQQLLSLAMRCEQVGDLVGAGKIYADIALICSEYQAYDKAWTYAERARGLLGTDPTMGQVHRVLADVYFHNHDDAKAQKHLENALVIFEQQGMAADLEEAVLVYCRHLNSKGEYQEAYRKLEH